MSIPNPKNGSRRNSLKMFDTSMEAEIPVTATSASAGTFKSGSRRNSVDLLKRLSQDFNSVSTKPQVKEPNSTVFNTNKSDDVPMRTANDIRTTTRDKDMNFNNAVDKDAPVNLDINIPSHNLFDKGEKIALPNDDSRSSSTLPSASPITHGIVDATDDFKKKPNSLTYEADHALPMGNFPSAKNDIEKSNDDLPLVNFIDNEPKSLNNSHTIASNISPRNISQSKDILTDSKGNSTSKDSIVNEVPNLPPAPAPTPAISATKAPAYTPIAPPISNQAGLKRSNMPIETNPESSVIHEPEHTTMKKSAPLIYDRRQHFRFDSKDKYSRDMRNAVKNDDSKEDADEKDRSDDINQNISQGNFPVTCKPFNPNPVDDNVEIYPEDHEAVVRNRINYTIVAVGIGSFLIGYLSWSVLWMLILIGGSVWAFADYDRIQKDAIDHQIQRHLGIKHLVSGNVETVEWLNHFINHIWTTLDPSLLVSVSDIVEDSLNAAMPAIIQAAHVQDLELGTQAPRILGIDIFPRNKDDPYDEIFGEIAFELHAYPSSKDTKLTPPHLNIHLLTGVKGVASTILPIKVEIQGLAGKARFKIRTMSKGPFLKHLDFAFTRLPKFDAAVFPLTSLNVLNLPLISHYAKNSINLALQEFVEPKFFPLDLETILTGDDQRHDTNALGVLKINVIEAYDLIKADVGSENDVFVTFSITHGKVVASTRIITSANPVWDETHFVPVNQSSLENDLDLIIQVWDSDKYDKDDKLGKVTYKLKDIVEKGKGPFFNGKVDLATTSTPGKKSKFKGILKLNIEYCPKFEKQQEIPEDALSAMLGCVIFQANGIEIVKEAYANKETSAPDPYVTMYINHEARFMTRTKLNNPAPYWNATSEHFVRDWKNTIITLVVKTRLSHEHNPVIGICHIELKKLFKEQGSRPKESTQWYSLHGGIGFGKVRFGLVVKPVQVHLPPNQLGNEVGTLVVDNLKIATGNASCDNYYVHAEMSMPPTSGQSTSPLHDSLSWDDDQFVIPIEQRYQNSIIFTVKQKSVLTGDKVIGRTMMSLKDLLDTKVERIQLKLHDKKELDVESGTTNTYYQPMDGFSSSVSQGILSFRIGFFPGLSYAHKHLLNTTLHGLDPKDMVLERNLLWSDPSCSDDEMGALARSSTETEDDEPNGDTIVIEDFNSNIKQPTKVSKSQTIRSLKWGKDQVKKKIMDLPFVKSGKNQNQPTIDKEM